MKDKIDPYTTPFTPWVCDRCGYIQKLMKKYSYNEYGPDDRDDFCLSIGGKEALCGECYKNTDKYNKNEEICNNNRNG